MLYVNFAMVHYPAAEDAKQLMSVYSLHITELKSNFFCFFLFTRPTLSYQRLHIHQPLSDNDLYDKIRRTVSNKHELQVLESFLVFNKYVRERQGGRGAEGGLCLN